MAYPGICNSYAVTPVYNPALTAVGKRDNRFRWLILGLILVCLLMWFVLPLVKVSYWGFSFSIKYLDMAIGVKIDETPSFGYGGEWYDEDEDFDNSSNKRSREGGKATYFLTLLPLLVAGIALLATKGLIRYVIVLAGATVRLISHLWITLDLEIAGQLGSLLFTFTYLIIIGLAVFGLINARRLIPRNY